MVDVRKLNLLLVEDDDDHAELVTYNLEEAGLINTLERSIDGEQAINYLESAYTNNNLPDLILLDLKLPKIDGLEVLERIKNDERLKNTPVVMLTTSDSERDQQTAYKHHVNGYLVKPVDFELFSNMVLDLANFWGRWVKFPTSTKTAQIAE